MDWHKLYFGRVSPEEVQKAVHDDAWQSVRLMMKGCSLEIKYEMLRGYLEGASKHVLREVANGAYLDRPAGSAARDLRMIEVRVTNYVTALSRGGLIKPSDYR